MFSHPVRRGAVVAAATASALALLTGPAFAHVTVNPREETQGNYAKLAFRVPNESDTAATVKVKVSFPLKTPLASVRVKPHDGWKARVTRTKLPEPVESGDYTLEEAVSAITWTAEKGVRIGPDEFDEFEVSVGPLPEEESLAFPAVQTYDDGEVVEWTEPVREGAAEPEHPAPVLTLTPEERGSGHGTAPAADKDEAGSDDPAAPVEVAAVGTSDQTARLLGGTGLGVGVLGLAAALLLLLAVRRKDAG
ncbi:YcnI family protein [Actinopolymorpha sp. B9G3]|uniref:YcnI family copper-binding membrane protein n=1 Tax=Actinopolymorpha sp. B9G3 TaxID=3158970 RepID=UPI0032D90D8C